MSLLSKIKNWLVYSGSVSKANKPSLSEPEQPTGNTTLLAGLIKSLKSNPKRFKLLDGLLIEDLFEYKILDLPTGNVFTGSGLVNRPCKFASMNRSRGNFTMVFAKLNSIDMSFLCEEQELDEVIKVFYSYYSERYLTLDKIKRARITRKRKQEREQALGRLNKSLEVYNENT